MDAYRTMSMTPRAYVKQLEVALANGPLARAIRSARVTYHERHPDYGTCYIMAWFADGPHAESVIDGMAEEVRRARRSGCFHSKQHE